MREGVRGRFQLLTLQLSQDPQPRPLPREGGRVFAFEATASSTAAQQSHQQTHQTQQMQMQLDMMQTLRVPLGLLRAGGAALPSMPELD